MEGSYIITIVLLVNILLLSFQVTSEMKQPKNNIVRYSKGILFIGMVVSAIMIFAITCMLIQGPQGFVTWTIIILILLFGIFTMMIYFNIVIIFSTSGFINRNIWRQEEHYSYDDIEWYQIHQDKIIIRVKDKEIQFQYATGGEKFSQNIKKYKTKVEEDD